MYLGNGRIARSVSPLKRVSIMARSQFAVAWLVRHVSRVNMCMMWWRGNCNYTAQGTWPVTRGACPSSSSRHLAAVCPVTLVFTNMSVLTLILRDNILDSTINSSQFSPLRPVGCGAGRGGRCLYPSESGWILSSGAAVIGIIRDEAGVAAVDQPASSRADAD